MKVHYHLLAFYLITLVFFPCSDANSWTTSGDVSFAVSTQTHSHDEGKDVCSPLCRCTCCAASIQLPTSLSNTAEMDSHNTKCSTPYSISYIVSSAWTIWQPPKIA